MFFVTQLVCLHAATCPEPSQVQKVSVVESYNASLSQGRYSWYRSQFQATPYSLTFIFQNNTPKTLHHTASMAGRFYEIYYKDIVEVACTCFLKDRVLTDDVSSCLPCGDVMRGWGGVGGETTNRALPPQALTYCTRPLLPPVLYPQALKDSDQLYCGYKT